MASNHDLMHQLFGPDPNPDDDMLSADDLSSGVDVHASNEMSEDAFDEMVQDGPKSGMVFDTVERLLEAYQLHAKAKGFCVIRRSLSQTSKYTVISCDRSGKSNCKKQTKRMNCGAHINAIRQISGEWMVSSVETSHNHELDPNMSALMAGHRRLSLHTKRQLEANDIAGLRVCTNIQVMEVISGGAENIGATPKDCRNFIDQRRRLRPGEGDADAIRKLFTRLQATDPRFFHLMDIGDDGRLRNVMWIHPRSIAAYEDFHDVVSFDTTYLVNQYQMPLATVVGVNHHYQSILLGCALLTHEHAGSFKWFFSNWLKAMGGVPPTAILTDQCESIRIAVKEVLSDTVHRLCLWHICLKIPAKFKSVADTKKSVENRFRIIKLL